MLLRFLLMGLENRGIRDQLKDAIAEPRRAPLIPGLADIKRAAVDAGALGAGISGSGPSLFALCRDRAIADGVAAAMTAAVRRLIGGNVQTYVSPIAPAVAFTPDATPKPPPFPD